MMLLAILFTLLVCCKSDPWNKDEFFQVLNVPTEKAPDFQVIEIFKRVCCTPSQAVAKFPLKSEIDEKDKWTKKKIWENINMKNHENNPYRLDCFQSHENKHLARIFSNPNIILMELLVTDCEKVPGVVKIKKPKFNHGDQTYYDNISINNVKHPRKNPTKLKDHTVEDNSESHETFEAKKKEKRDHWKCVHFEVSEKKDEESNCEDGITFGPNEWKEVNVRK